MNLITITDEMLESAHIEESDKENLKKALAYFHGNTKINLSSFVSNIYIKQLSSLGLAFLYGEIISQSYKAGFNESIKVLNDKLIKVKESGLMNEDYINGWDDAIFDLKKVYSNSLDD